jgi:DNA-binding response OmpR family regulator
MPDKANGGSGTILIVDDNAMNRDMLSRRLQREGYDILCASNGRDGLDTVAKSDIDLILLDILMPEMDGYQVLRELKKDPATARLPVIMLTAVNDVDSVKRCIDLGADDYLIKPFNSVLLRSRIEVVIRDSKIGESGLD